MEEVIEKLKHRYEQFKHKCDAKQDGKVMRTLKEINLISEEELRM